MNPYLRPASGLELLGNAVRLFKDHLASLVLVALVPHAVLLVLELAMMMGGQPGAGAIYLFLAVTIAMNALALAAITRAAGQAALGIEPTVPAVYGQTLRGNLAVVVLAYLFNATLVSAGFMLLILPGLLFGGLFAPLIPIIVLERKRLFQAIGRSVTLMRGQLPKGVAVFAYFILVAGVLPFLFVLLQAGANTGPLTPLLGAIIGAVTLPLGFSANVMLYLSLRAGEGYTAEELQRDLAPAQPEAQ